MRCFRKKNHSSAFCDRFGNQVQGECEKAEENSRTSFQLTLVQNGNVITRSIHEIVLQVAKATVKSLGKSDKKAEVCVLLDTGSQSSFISEPLAKKLGVSLFDHGLVVLHTFAARESKQCKLPKAVKGTKDELKIRLGADKFESKTLVQTLWKEKLGWN